MIICPVRASAAPSPEVLLPSFLKYQNSCLKVFPRAEITVVPEVPLRCRDYSFLDMGDGVDLQELVNILEAARGRGAAVPD
jgi:hypothetical protein